MRSAFPRLAVLALFLAPAAVLAQSTITYTVDPKDKQTTPPVPAQQSPVPADAPATQQPAQDASPAVPAVDPVSGKPITDTLTYTVDPVTGQTTPGPQETTPPALPPTRAERKAALAARHSAFDSRYHFAILATIGTAGAGIQVGIPLVPHFALRVGGDYIRYSGVFQEDAATITASLQFGYGRVALDYFPWAHRRFHITPLLVFANQTHVQANVAIDPNQQFDFNGQQFRGSATDPLSGVGRVDLRKTSPGITVGFGNLTHGKGHWTFPVEMGFFYNGQPQFQVNFSGTVCAVNQPPAVGCQTVQNQAEFQQDLTAFRNRQIHNLSYARFIPVFNFGTGYRF